MSVRRTLSSYEDTCNSIHDYPHQAQKNYFPIHLVLFFFEKGFFKPRNVSWVFDLDLDTFWNDKYLIFNTQEVEWDVLMYSFFYKAKPFSTLLITFFWWERLGNQFFLREVRNLLRYMKILPGNNFGDTFNFCHYESIARWESSLSNCYCQTNKVGKWLGIFVVMRCFQFLKQVDLHFSLFYIKMCLQS